MSSWWTERFSRLKFNEAATDPNKLQSQKLVEEARQRIDFYRKSYAEVVGEFEMVGNLQDSAYPLIIERLLEATGAAKDKAMRTAVRSALPLFPADIPEALKDPQPIETLGLPMLRKHAIFLETEVGPNLNYRNAPDIQIDTLLCFLDEKNNTTQIVRRYVTREDKKYREEFGIVDVFSDPTYPAIMSIGGHEVLYAESAEPSLLSRLTTHVLKTKKELIGPLFLTQTDKAQYVLKYGSLG